MAAVEELLPPLPRAFSLRTHLRSAAAMLERDLSVVLRQWPFTVARVTMQPLLFVFIFAYVFPLVGQGIGGAAGSADFAALLVPGTLAMTLFLNGIQAVTLPMINDFGATREIEDRASCPLPLTWLAAEKVIAGAVESLAAAPLVAVFAIVVPSTEVHVQLRWATIIPLAILISVAGAALGLLLGVLVRPSQVQAMFTVLVLPMTFLGATYYPWAVLNRLPWLEWLIAVNPLLYANESLRATMAPQIMHINPAVSTTCLGVITILFFWLGVLQLRHRLAARTQ